MALLLLVVFIFVFLCGVDWLFGYVGVLELLVLATICELRFCCLLCMGLVNSVGLFGFIVCCGFVDLFVFACFLVILLGLIV